MMRLARISAVGAIALVCGSLVAEGAEAKIPSGVTIHYKQSRGLYGFVFSRNPDRCADGRGVKVFRQKGKKQTRRDATRMGYPIAHKTSRGKYRWQLDPVLMHELTTGRYFAMLGHGDNRCQGDSSKTIRITVSRPNTKITGMAIHHRSHRVRFQYAATGGSKPYHFRCRLDPDYARRQHCDRDGKTFVHVSPGRHVFTVKAIGANGLDDASAAKVTFRM